MFSYFISHAGHLIFFPDTKKKEKRSKIEINVIKLNKTSNRSNLLIEHSNTLFNPLLLLLMKMAIHFLVCYNVV